MIVDVIIGPAPTGSFNEGDAMRVVQQVERVAASGNIDTYKVGEIIEISEFLMNFLVMSVTMTQVLDVGRIMPTSSTVSSYLQTSAQVTSPHSITYTDLISHRLSTHPRVYQLVLLWVVLLALLWYLLSSWFLWCCYTKGR